MIPGMADWGNKVICGYTGCTLYTFVKHYESTVFQGGISVVVPPSYMLLCPCAYGHLNNSCPLGFQFCSIVVLTERFLLLRIFSVAISVGPHVCFILDLILISMFLT